MTMSLKDILKVFVDFRHEVIVRRTQFDLEKAQRRAHILEGLLKAIDVIDEIIRIIRASKSVDDAKAELMSTFGFTEIQPTVGLICASRIPSQSSASIARRTPWSRPTPSWRCVCAS